MPIRTSFPTEAEWQDIIQAGNCGKQVASYLADSPAPAPAEPVNGRSAAHGGANGHAPANGHAHANGSANGPTAPNRGPANAGPSPTPCYASHAPKPEPVAAPNLAANVRAIRL